MSCCGLLNDRIKMALITYKGIKQNSSIERTLTDEEFKQIAEEYYKKPDFSEVQEQLMKVAAGGTTINKIVRYYLREVMSKAIGPGASWSIYDGLHYKPIMEYFAGKVDVNDKVFPKSLSLAKNIETAFRLCGIRYCVNLPNYPISSVDYILKKYNTNGKYYDFSCGWAARLLGSLHNGIEYFGTDPNYELVAKLEEIVKDYSNLDLFAPSAHIWAQGSEHFIPELEGKIGIAFSSPPYFSLEDYVIGDQSYKPGMEYRDWLEGYLRPTIQNIKRYLTPDGTFCINVKDFKEFPLESDTQKIALGEGFRLHCIEDLVNIKRCHGDAKTARGEKLVSMNDNSEKIFVFKKT